MKKIPDELLNDIFLQVVVTDFNRTRLEPDARDSGDDDGGNVILPWNIATVCTWWRRVCLDNPKLWSYITFQHHSCENANSIATPLRTYTQLERAKSSPLHVDAYAECVCPSLRSAVRIVTAECHRWRTVRFNDKDFGSSYFSKRSICSRGLPCLYSMDWRCGKDVHFTTKSHLINLRSVILRSLTASLTGFYLTSFPWNQITTFHLVSSNFDLQGLLSMLSECVNLVYFRYRNGVIRDSAVTGFEHGSITLQHLISLDLLNTENAAHNISPKKFLPYLCTPSLRSVKYGLFGRDSDTVFADLVERSLCTLTRLDVYSFGMVWNWRLLPLAPQLESVVVRDCNTPVYGMELADCDGILDKLFWEDSKPSDNILPNLKRLTLHDFVFDPAVLVHVVESRRSPTTIVTPIQGLKVVFDKAAHEDVKSSRAGYCRAFLEERLSDAVKGGFDLQLEM